MPETTLPPILLVDDEEGIRTVLGLTLADAGYEVTTAATGEEGLRLFAERRPPIILSDIKMPGLSGLELLERVKAVDPEVEVIMITGHGDMDLAIASLKRDACDFITKPINDDILEIALRRARERIEFRRERRERAENLERLVREQSAQLIEAERHLAAMQAVHGLSHALHGLGLAVDDGPGVFNELPCFVSLHTRWMEIVSVNQLYRERLGDLVGKPSWEAYAGRESGGNGCPVWVAVETGRGYRGRETLVGKDGRQIPVVVHTAPILNNDGDVDLVLEISVDVTEAQRLREELLAVQQRWQRLFDEAPCYITVQDRNLRLTAANKRFRDDFGEGVGRPCFEIYAHRQSPCAGCPVALTFEDGQSHQFETVVASKDGEPVNVLIWTAPLPDAKGEIAQVMEMSTNITQLRRLQDRLTTLGLLLGSTAHGVKGLLTALDGGVYRLGSGLARKDEARIQEGFADVKHLAERIKKTVLDILWYAKKRELNWTVVEGRSFAEELASLVKAKAAARQVALLPEFEPGLGAFEADEASLAAALMNILENAVDACGASGRPGVVRFGARGDDGHVVFTVADNGVGMDQATRERLFTLFFSSKGSAGTGIGLFVSNQIIRQHGGEVRVESELGQGTTFTVRLPRTLPESAKSGEVDAGAEQGGRERADRAHSAVGPD